MAHDGNGSSHLLLEREIRRKVSHLPDGSIKILGQNSKQRSNGNGNGALGTSAVDRQPLRVDFLALADGTKVELVRQPESGELQFLIWSGCKFRTASSLNLGNRVFSPPLLEPVLVTRLRLPSTIRHCGNPTDLTKRLSQRLLHFVDISEEIAWLISNYVLYTWVFDAYHVACYLWVVGSYGCGKSTLLRFLGSVCRRGMIIGDASSAFLCRLPALVRPTLIFDEYETNRSGRTRETNRILRLGSTRDGVIGRTVAGSECAYDVFCPKIIASTDLPDDAALNSRALSISLIPSKRCMPPLSDQAIDALAEEFQPELLMFRLRNLDSVRANEQLSVGCGRNSDQLRALSLPLLGESGLEARLLTTIEPYARERMVDRSFEPEAIVLRALMYVCHYENGHQSCGNINEYVRRAGAEVGEDFNISERKLGQMLRTNFRISTKKLGNWGRGIELTRATRCRIHDLASRYGLTKADILDWQAVRSGYGGVPCKLCEQFGLLAESPGGKPLRVVPQVPPRRIGESLFAGKRETFSQS